MNLHSTMVRFESDLCSFDIEIIPDLHSTMVRFESMPSPAIRPQLSQFTFHYG